LVQVERDEGVLKLKEDLSQYLFCLPRAPPWLKAIQGLKLAKKKYKGEAVFLFL